MAQDSFFLDKNSSCIRGFILTFSSRKSARECAAVLPVLPAVEAPKTLGRVAVVHPPPLRRIALDLRGALEGLLAKSEGADIIRSLECFQWQIFARKALQAEVSAPSGMIFFTVYRKRICF